MDEKKRIMFVCNNLGLGGLEKMIGFIANFLIKYDYRVLILCTHEATIKLNLDDKIQIIDLHSNCRRNKSKNWIQECFYKVKLLFQLRRWTKKSNPHLIIAFNWWYVSLTALANVFNNVKILGSERGDPIVASLEHPKWYNWGYSRCERIVYQSQAVLQYIQPNLKKKGVIIPNPCISKSFEQECSDLSSDIHKREKIIFSGGRLDNKQKRFDVLINAFEIVLKKHPDYKLHIFGSGSSYRELNSLILSKKLENNIIFKGYVADVCKITKNYTAFVLSSDFEGVPNMLIEAMNAGIPCISTDFSPGAIEEIMKNKERGLVVPCSDVQAMADAINFYIENPEIAEQYAKNALKIREELDPECIGNKWLSIINEIIDS